MRIAFVANCPIPYHTPILNHLAELADLKVLFMSRSHPGQRSHQGWAGFDDPWGQPPRFDYTYYWSQAVTIPSLDFRTQVSVGVTQELAKRDPDVVMFSSWGPLMAEPLLWKLFAGKRAVMWAESTTHSGLLRGFLSNSVRRLLLSRVDAFVSNGSQATAFLRDLGVSESRVITSCLPTHLTARKVTNAEHSASPTFLFVGRLVPLKRPESAIRAFGRIRHALPGARLTVVGDGPLLPKVAKLAAETGGVDLVGRKEGAALAAYYESSDILVVPSVREVWGLVVNEALANGTYVIATDQVGSAHDLLTPIAGRIVPADDETAMAEALLKAARDLSVLRGSRKRRAEAMKACTPERFAVDAYAAADLAALGLASQPPATLANRIRAEQREWDEAAMRIGGREARLVAVSRFVGDSRVYKTDGAMTKIRRLSTSLPKGVHGLRAESAVARLAGRPNQYTHDSEWEWVQQPWLPGMSLESALPALGIRDRLKYLLPLRSELTLLHRRGIAHCDLRPENVVLTADGPRLIDFGRAMVCGPVRAALADGLGLGTVGSSSAAWRLALFTLVPRSQSLARRLRWLLSFRRRSGGHLTGPLRAAWQLAEESPANSPGQGIAYYALTAGAVHYPGERSWYERWEPIRRAIDFRNKSVIELGCNMGLVSSFSMLEGARSAIGVDRDARILKSARVTAAVLGVAPRFALLDILREDGWEDRLGVGDVLFVLSLIHWLPSPDRVLSYMGRFAEAVFEGHGSTEFEVNRIRQIGFSSVDIIHVTERGRALIHAKR